MSKQGIQLLVLQICSIVILCFFGFSATNAKADDGSSDIRVDISGDSSGYTVNVSYKITEFKLNAGTTFTGEVNAGSGIPDDWRFYYDWRNDAACKAALVNPDAGHYYMTVYKVYPGYGEVPQYGMFQDLDCQLKSDPAPNTNYNVGVNTPALVGNIYEQILFPTLHANWNPHKSIVTFPNWFWMELPDNSQWKGTDPDQGGKPFGVTINIPRARYTLTVRVQAFQYRWDFGEDSNRNTMRPITNVGRKYPERSNVVYWYNQMSTFYPKFEVSYKPQASVNGGGWIDFPALVKTNLWEDNGGIRVMELQTILVPADPPCERGVDENCGP